MFGSFRRHQKLIWFVIIVALIPGLVFVFSSISSLGDFFSPRRWGNIGSKNHYFMEGTDQPVTIGGEPVTKQEFFDARQETRLAYFMRTGGREWPAQDSATKKRLDLDAVYRVFLIHRMKDLDIHISDAAVARMARERLGEYPLASFEKEHLSPNGLTVEDFVRFMRTEGGIQQLVGAAAVSAKLVSPREAEILYRKGHDEIAVEVAGFWATNYLDKVTVTNEAVARFYTNRMAAYRIPERTVVSYVEFVATNFFADADKRLSEATNLSAFLDETYLRLGATNQYFKDTNGVPLPEKEAKEKIKQDQRHLLALREAHRNANQFGTELMDQPEPNRVENLDKLAAAKGLTVKTTPPFNTVTGLDEEEFGEEFRERALKLTQSVPIAFNPIVSSNTVFVIALKSKVPSELPPLEKILDKVTADYKQAQAQEMARKDGTNFLAKLTNGLAQGKSFAELAAQERVKPLSVPPFSASTSTLTNLDPHINLRSLQQVAFDLKPGTASPFTPSPDGGFVAYVRAKLPLDEAKVAAELPQFITRMRLERQNEAFNQWFRKQAEQAKLFVPQPKDAAGGTPGAAN